MSLLDLRFTSAKISPTLESELIIKIIENMMVTDRGEHHLIKVIAISLRFQGHGVSPGLLCQTDCGAMVDHLGGSSNARSW